MSDTTPPLSPVARRMLEHVRAAYVAGADAIAMTLLEWSTLLDCYPRSVVRAVLQLEGYGLIRRHGGAPDPSRAVAIELAPPPHVPTIDPAMLAGLEGYFAEGEKD